MKIGTITKGQLLTMNKKVRRESDIANGVKPMGHAIHKSKKTYSRKNQKFID